MVMDVIHFNVHAVRYTLVQFDDLIVICDTSLVIHKL